VIELSNIPLEYAENFLFIFIWRKNEDLTDGESWQGNIVLQKVA